MTNVEVRSRSDHVDRLGNRNETAALPVRKGGGSAGWPRKACQLLRRPSAARFHSATLSATMRVDFIAAWLSWA
jgi:hypothetical protein